MRVCVNEWLFDWLTEPLNEWQTACLSEWVNGWMNDWLTNCLWAEQCLHWCDQVEVGVVSCPSSVRNCVWFMPLNACKLPRCAPFHPSPLPRSSLSMSQPFAVLVLPWAIDKWWKMQNYLPLSRFKLRCEYKQTEWVHSWIWSTEEASFTSPITAIHSWMHSWIHSWIHEYTREYTHE